MRGKTLMITEASLYISDLRPSDFGVYTCIAENERGIGTANVTLMGMFSCVHFVLIAHCTKSL